MYQLLTIIGRLGADPELRYTPAGVPVCSFNVATDKTWNNDQGQKQTETTWHRVTVWRKRAEVCAQYLSKGKMVLVTGSVKANGYTNRNGQIAASLEVTADQVAQAILRGIDKRQAEIYADAQTRALARTVALTPGIYRALFDQRVRRV